MDNITNDALRREIQEVNTVVDPRLTMPNNIDVIKRFFDVAAFLIKQPEVLEDYPSFAGVSFNRFHPAVAPFDPSIIYNIVDQSPAKADVKEQTRFASFSGRNVRELRPRIMQRNRPIPGHPGYVADISMMRTDATVSFCMYSVQGNSVDEISQAFVDFMLEMAGVFQYSGIERITWLGETEPGAPRRWSEELVVREQRYRVRYQRLFFHKNRKLNNLAVKVKRVYGTLDSLGELSEEISRREDFEENTGFPYPLDEFQAKLDDGGA